jgi:hypothetical protein
MNILKYKSFLDLIAQWKQRSMDKEWRRGYDWAAGAILRGESSARKVFDQAVMPDPFDRGALAAIDRLVELGVVCSPW